MGLTAEQIIAANDRKLERVEVPEWGGDGYVFVRSLSLGEALAVNKETAGIEDSGEIMAVQLAAFLSDDQGNALFTDTTSARQLLTRRPEVLARLLKAGQTLNHSGSVEDEKQKS